MGAFRVLARRLRALLAALTCASALAGGLPRSANAQPAPDFFVRLRYVMDKSQANCWNEQQFRQAVARGVGYDPFRADAALAVEVGVSGSARLLDGRLEWKSPSGAGMGERRFFASDGDCSRLLTEMSFAVGLQIELLRPRPHEAVPATEPSRSSSFPPRASASSAGRATQRAPSPSAMSRDARDPGTGRGAAPAFRLWLGAGPSLAWGLSPKVTGQGRLFLMARRASWSFELGALGTLPVVERRAGGAGFRQYWLAGSTAACGHVGVLSACLLGEAGAINVTGFGVDQPRSPSAFVAHLGARVAANTEISERWLLTTQVEALGLLTPRSVALQRAPVWDMPALSFSAGIALAGRFR